jgi:hypothetical protein
VDQPDVVIAIGCDAGDLIQDPVVGKGFGPVRIDDITRTVRKALGTLFFNAQPVSSGPMSRLVMGIKNGKHLLMMSPLL